MEKRAISYGGTDDIGRTYERLRKRSYRRLQRSITLQRALFSEEAQTRWTTPGERHAALIEWTNNPYNRNLHEQYVAGVRDALSEVGW